MNTASAPEQDRDLAALLAQEETEIALALGDLSPGQLAEAHALETAGANRAALLAAIVAELDAARAGGDESAGDALDAVNAAEAAGASPPPPAESAPPRRRGGGGKGGRAPRAEPPDDPWRAEDYTGPLTATQADWRNRHLKPQNVVVTK